MFVRYNSTNVCNKCLPFMEVFMINNNSELRIRNNRIRRVRQLRRNIIMCLLTFMLVICFSVIFFSFKTKAQGNQEEILYKYYKSIMVSEGDSLWKYAQMYGDNQYYDSYEDYMQEVMNMNFLKDETITIGQYLVIPYYSNKFI